MKHYTYEDVLLALKNIIHAKGEDYVYEKTFDGRCVYYDPDTQQPSCLVGHFIHQEGILGFDEIDEYEDDNAQAMILSLRYNHIAWFDKRAEWLLQYAQEAQDYGNPWGKSLEYGIEAAARQVGA